MLRRGDRGSDVVALRHALASLGHLPPDIGPVNGWSGGTNGASGGEFDQPTDRAVRAFQQQRGLIVDGIVGPVTARALTDARWTLGDRTLAYVVSAMMTGDDVTSLQVRLAEFGYNTGRPDGIFGPRTDTAVRGFQRARGVSEDGVFGPATLRELNLLKRMSHNGRPFLLREQEHVRSSGPWLRGKRIVIDPAHGGSDTGWVAGSGDGGQVRAADLTFDIARRLEGRMVATGMETFLTRGRHQNPTPEDRALLANEVDADLLLSLHIDGSFSPLANGVATFHFGSDAGASSSLGESLAELVQRELVARTGLADCRVHHKPWDLLRLTRMPAIQVELGYLSNAGDRSRLVSEDFRDTVVDGLLVAVKRLYLGGRDDPGTGVFTFKELLAYEQWVGGA